MKFYVLVFEKYSNVHHNHIPSGAIPVVTFGQKDGQNEAFGRLMEMFVCILFYTDWHLQRMYKLHQTFDQFC